MIMESVNYVRRYWDVMVVGIIFFSGVVMAIHNYTRAPVFSTNTSGSQIIAYAINTMYPANALSINPISEYRPEQISRYLNSNDRDDTVFVIGGEFKFEPTNCGELKSHFDTWVNANKKTLARYNSPAIIDAISRDGFFAESLCSKNDSTTIMPVVSTISVVDGAVLIDVLGLYVPIPIDAELIPNVLGIKTATMGNKVAGDNTFSF